MILVGNPKSVGPHTFEILVPYIRGHLDFAHCCRLGPEIYIASGAATTTSLNRFLNLNIRNLS